MMISEESKQLNKELDITIALQEFDLPEIGFADLPINTWLGIAGITAAGIANRIGYCKLKYKDDKSKAKKCIWWWVKDKKEKKKVKEGKELQGKGKKEKLSDDPPPEQPTEVDGKIIPPGHRAVVGPGGKVGSFDPNTGRSRYESAGPNLNKELSNIMNGGEISPRAKTYADYARENHPEAIQEAKSKKDDIFLRPKTKEYRRWKTGEEDYSSQSSFRQPTSRKLKRRSVRRKADKVKEGYDPEKMYKKDIYQKGDKQSSTQYQAPSKKELRRDITKGGEYGSQQRKKYGKKLKSSEVEKDPQGFSTHPLKAKKAVRRTKKRYSESSINEKGFLKKWTQAELPIRGKKTPETPHADTSYADDREDRPINKAQYEKAKEIEKGVYPTRVQKADSKGGKRSVYIKGKKRMIHGPKWQGSISK